MFFLGGIKMVKKPTLKNIKENLTLQTFLWALALSFGIFIIWIIYHCGYFFFYGDFNVQQIPFHQMIHDSILSGNIGWSYTTDLGANIIGSYSFYMIGSPFFWAMLPFPSEVVPYLIAPMLMLKFSLAATGAYLFLRRYVRNQRYAMIGALLYAFSGFGIYNIFFNHFHEAMVTFPFMLAAMDAHIYDKKKGFLGISIFAGAFINYYFFAGQSIFILMYWCFRMVSGSYRMKLREFFVMLLEILVGFLCAGVILVPSVLAVLQNSRVSNWPHGWNAVVYSSEQRYLHIVESFFFPPDMPAYSNFTPDSNAKWASVAAWLPLFSMVGVFSFYKLRTHKWLRELIPVLCIITIVPVFNSIFQVLNITYYARWYYMFTLMLSLATIISLDHTETDFKPGLIRTFVITAALTVLVGLMPEKWFTDSEFDGTLGLEKYPDRFWAWVGVAFLGLIALTIILCLRKNEKVFRISVCVSLSVMIVGYGNLLVGTGVVNCNYNHEYIADDVIANKGVFNKEFDDLTTVRSDFYEMMDNVGMFWQIPTIQAFQSIVPGSVMDFYKSVGVERSVGSRPKTDVYGIRSFLSVKYLFDLENTKEFRNSMGTTEMPGWTLRLTKNNYNVYENDYYIPYGFTYDEYITREEYDNVSESNRHLLLLKAMVLTDEQAKKYGDILKHHSDVSDYTYSQREYYKDCSERKERVCSSVKFEKNKITAKFDAGSSDELVFFSIPYEDGWSATVNGKDVQIEKVNVGFMAVRVPAGRESEIVFRYRTPGLALGGIVSAGAAIIFVLYMLLFKMPPKKRSYYNDYIEDYDGYPDCNAGKERFDSQGAGVVRQAVMYTADDGGYLGLTGMLSVPVVDDSQTSDDSSQTSFEVRYVSYDESGQGVVSGEGEKHGTGAENAKASADSEQSGNGKD